MNYRFENYIESASASKKNFERDLEGIKDSLQSSIQCSASDFSPSAAKTGWLRGSLSYPWVLICSIAPAIKEIF